MRNMKSLHIFQNYVIKEEKFLGTLWECEKPKVNVTQRSPWNSIYVTFSFMRMVRISLLILSVDRWIRVDYSPHFFSPLSCELWKYFVGFISCWSLTYLDYSLILWVIWIILSRNMCCELFPSWMPSSRWLSN